ncbi:MAG: phosphomannose isomerase type II C-terminal cupin domain [Candidatus Micrarchaeota archaeon]|nr:phosphomannose isomerase type II C-terminal cupin domain [Candidatus Micrarchaeota archaeon]
MNRAIKSGRFLIPSKKITDVRPWGGFEQFVNNEKCSVKLLYIKKGKRLSYQYHNHRSEVWHVVSGRVLMTINGKNLLLGKGGEAVIPVKAKHRGKGLADAVILEIDYGKFDEDDIVRLQDDFNRK